VYSNCDKVTLYADGKSLGRKVMPKDGHLVWKAKEKATKYTAKGYVAGKMVASDK
jgi:beta-galactosidase